MIIYYGFDVYTYFRDFGNTSEKLGNFTDTCTVTYAAVTYFPIDTATVLIFIRIPIP